MNLRFFIGLSGLLLASWLVVTFLVAVPAKHYPLLGKRPHGGSAQPETTTSGVVAEEAGDVLVSGSLR